MPKSLFKRSGLNLKMRLPLKITMILILMNVVRVTMKSSLVGSSMMVDLVIATVTMIFPQSVENDEESRSVHNVEDGNDDEVESSNERLLMYLLVKVTSVFGLSSK